jgi:hypothetical protein
MYDVSIIRVRSKIIRLKSAVVSMTPAGIILILLPRRDGIFRYRVE